MKLLIDVEQSKSLKEAERISGKTKEEILQLCLSTHLFKELGSSSLSAFLGANDFVEVQPDTILD